jgi:hypothetical protein
LRVDQGAFPLCTFFLSPGHGSLGLLVGAVVHGDVETLLRDVQGKVLRMGSVRGELGYKRVIGADIGHSGAGRYRGAEQDIMTLDAVTRLSHDCQTDQADAGLRGAGGLHGRCCGGTERLSGLSGTLSDDASLSTGTTIQQFL